MCRKCTQKSIESSRSIHWLLENPSSHAVEAYRDSGEARCANRLCSTSTCPGPLAPTVLRRARAYLFAFILPNTLYALRCRSAVGLHVGCCKSGLVPAHSTSRAHARALLITVCYCYAHTGDRRETVVRNSRGPRKWSRTPNGHRSSYQAHPRIQGRIPAEPRTSVDVDRERSVE